MNRADDVLGVSERWACKVVGQPRSTQRSPIPTPGPEEERIRERLRLKYRDIEEASQKIAAARQNDEFGIALSRLADIENKGTMPSIYRLYSLCAIYRLDLDEVLPWIEEQISLGQI